jgi:hypothetical protein
MVSTLGDRTTRFGLGWGLTLIVAAAIGLTAAVASAATSPESEARRDGLAGPRRIRRRAPESRRTR